MDPSPANSPIFQLFNQYQKSCLDAINDSSSNPEVQIRFMTKIIKDLLDQNRQLLILMSEIQQCSNDKACQMHDFLVNTATKTVDIGQALTSFELQTKQLVEIQLPSVVECGNLIEKLNSSLNYYEYENENLRQRNGILSENMDNLKNELVRCKDLIYNLTFKSSSESVTESQCSSSKTGHIDLFLDKKLTEQTENIDSVICGMVLDELIQTVEDHDSSHWAKLDDQTNTDSLYECIDGSDSEEFEENWCNILLDSGNNNYETFPHIELNDTRCLKLLSIVLNELKNRNSVISNLRSQTWSYRKHYLELYDRYIRCGLETLELLIDCHNRMKNDQDFISILDIIAQNIETDIRQLIDAKFNETKILDHCKFNPPLSACS